MSTISSIKTMEIKHDIYRGKDCMTKFCKSLAEHTMEKISFRKKLLINKQRAEVVWKCKHLLYL